MTHDQTLIQQILQTLHAMDWPDALHDKFEDATEKLAEIRDGFEDEFGDPIEPGHPCGEPSIDRVAA